MNMLTNIHMRNIRFRQNKIYGIKTRGQTQKKIRHFWRIQYENKKNFKHNDQNFYPNNPEIQLKQP